MADKLNPRNARERAQRLAEAEKVGAAAQRTLGVDLPQDVKEFLVIQGGQRPKSGWFPVPSARGTVWCGPIAYFLATSGPTYCRMENLTQASRNQERLPAHYVAIAQMLTQPSILLVSTAAEDYGAIYAWRGGRKRFRPDQLLRVAGSITEFVGLLTEPPPEVAATFRQSVADHRSGTTRRPPPADYDGPEALGWLRSNRNEAALAVNHFGTTDAARRFVEDLYAAGALRVIIAENSVRNDDLGPYADAIVVFLPESRAAREVLCRRCERELDEPAAIDANDPNPIFLWWD